MAMFNLLASDIIDLELKLEGKLSINRDELLALASSWGRYEWFYTYDKDGNDIKINESEPKEKYDLSKLDVSKIKDFDYVFACSNFNGDISLWNVSNATSMESMFFKAKEFNSPLDKWDVYHVTSMSTMFYEAENFNQSLNNWNISKVTNMDYMFAYSKSFNQPVLWDLSTNNEQTKFVKKVMFCYNMFHETQAFEKKFNNGKDLPINTSEMKEWLKVNQNKMIAIDVENTKSLELDNFILNLDKKEINNGNI